MGNLLNKRKTLALIVLEFFSKDIGADINSSAIIGCIQ